MVCMNCKKIVSDGLFCSICGWDQRKDPARCTLNEVHNRWKKKKALPQPWPERETGIRLGVEQNRMSGRASHSNDPIR